MRRSLAFLAAVFLLASAAGCGKDGPASPTPSETRIISLTGDINFGDVEVGQASDRTVRITNIGNAALTVDAIVGSADLVEVFFTSLVTSRTVQPGAFVDIIVQFRPLQARQYLAIANIRGNMTSGTNSFSVSGVGVVR